MFKEIIDWFFKEKIDYSKRSEKFIRFFKNYVDWYGIWIERVCSEDFMREFKEYLEIGGVAENQKLSESFMREFKSLLSWSGISYNQKLSETFIREFQDDLNWVGISQRQKLSEEFIKEFKDRVQWNEIVKFQILSENFIDEFINRIVKMTYPAYGISRYQKLSSVYIEKNNIEIRIENHWLYATDLDKEKFIINYTDYKIESDEKGQYILAYKTTRKNGYAVISYLYKYEVGETYESSCDCSLTRSNSFGLSAWSKKNALRYYNKGELYLVKIYLRDIGAIIINNYCKIRCFKQTIMKRIK